MDLGSFITNAVLTTGAAASAVSGGVSAGPGETVVTGDSSASVQVVNMINANDEGGIAETIIEKTIDGVTTRTEETKNFAPGEPVIVEVSATAKSEGKSSASGEETVSPETENIDAVSLATSSASTSSSSASTSAWKNVRVSVVERMSTFFVSVFSFIRFW